MKLQTFALLVLLTVPCFGQTTTYENKSYGFTIVLPSTWKIFEPGVVDANGFKENLALEALSGRSELDVIVSDLYSSKSNENGEYSRKQIDESFDQDSLSKLSETLVKRMQSLRQDFHLYEKGITKLDGSVAVHIRYSAQMPSVSEKGLSPKMITNEILTKNGVMYSILFSTQPDYYEITKKTNAEVIATFHVQPLPTSLLEAKTPPKKSGFFRNIFSYIVDNIALNVFLWVVLGVIAGLVAIVGVVRSLFRRRS